jgi:hypothetical protein
MLLTLGCVVVVVVFFFFSLPPPPENFGDFFPHGMCCFAEVLQMNDLLNREHFSHALTYCICDTTCNWASVLMFQCRYDNATLSLTCLAMGMLYFPVLGKLIKGTV